MNGRIAIVSMIALMVLTLGATIAPARATKTAADHTLAAPFKVDPVHTSLIFRIEHLGVSHFYGRINDPTGTFTLDPDSPDAGLVAIDAEVEKIDTANERRDNHLKSADFFNGREFPKITFRSTKITAIDDTSFSVTGTLTMHGVTKEITARIENFRAAETNMGHRAGFTTTFRIKRSDFGINLYIDNGALGDEVQITAAVEGIGG